MGRSLERRAEGIKGFFDAELRKVPYLPSFSLIVHHSYLLSCHRHLIEASSLSCVCDVNRAK
jgi:hypothetical protein